MWLSITWAITVPSLHHLAALHQWLPSVCLTSSYCSGNRRHLQREKTLTNSNWGKREKSFSHRKHPAMEGTVSLGEKQIWCYSSKTPQQLLIFSIFFCCLSQSPPHISSFFTSVLMVGSSLPMMLSLPLPQLPPSLCASLNAASSKLERRWRALSECKCVLNSTRGSGGSVFFLRVVSQCSWNNNSWLSLGFFVCLFFVTLQCDSLPLSGKITIWGKKVQSLPLHRAVLLDLWGKYNICWVLWIVWCMWLPLKMRLAAFIQPVVLHFRNTVEAE